MKGWYIYWQVRVERLVRTPTLDKLVGEEHQQGQETSGCSHQRSVCAIKNPFYFVEGIFCLWLGFDKAYLELGYFTLLNSGLNALGYIAACFYTQGVLACAHFGYFAYTLLVGFIGFGATL